MTFAISTNYIIKVNMKFNYRRGTTLLTNKSQTNK